MPSAPAGRRLRRWRSRCLERLHPNRRPLQAIQQALSGSWATSSNAHPLALNAEAASRQQPPAASNRQPPATGSAAEQARGRPSASGRARHRFRTQPHPATGSDPAGTRETGTTTPPTIASPLPSPRRRCRFGALLASLLLASAAATAPLRAAELLEVRLEGLALPLNLRQLQVWARQPEDRSAVDALAEADLLVWLNLLSPATQRDLRQLLNTPLLRERSFG
ncbi:MAG: hypothetical protein ACKN89_10095, partial [Cyanobium sp.]